MKINNELHELIQTLKALGVQLQVSGDQLHIKAPPKSLDEPTKERIRTNKKQLIAHLKRAHQKYIPSLDSQKGIWLLQQLAPEAATYNIAGCYEIKGELNIQALQQSLATLQLKHELLRCSAAWLNDDLFFIEDCQTPIPLQVHQLAARNLDITLQEQLNTAFDVQSAPLAKVFINQISEKSELFYLHIVLQHLIADAWSCGILAKDLAFNYWQLSQGLSVEVEQPAYQFSDFAADYRYYKSDYQFKNDADYWQQRLAGCPERLNIPSDNQANNQGATIHERLSAIVWDKINKCFKQLGVSPFQFLSTLFALVLHKYARQEEVVIGYPISGREQQKDESVFGNLINMLPFRVKVDQHCTLKEFILQQKELLLCDWEHKKFPFDHMVRFVPHHHNATHNPLFQHVFVMQNTPMRVDEIEQNKVKLYPYATTNAKFDLCLSAIPFATGELELSLEFHQKIVHPHSAKSILNAFLFLLDTLPLETSVQQLRFIHHPSWESCFISSLTYQSYPLTPTVVELFQQRVIEQPDQIALKWRQEKLSYRQLHEYSNRLAHALQTKGIHTGQLVGVALERNLDLVPLLIALLKIGAAYLPLDVHAPKERLNNILNNAQLQFLITEPHLELTVKHKITLTDLKGIAYQQEIILSPLNASNCAYVIYTSGSTGMPNGVPITHGNLVRLFHSTKRLFNFTAADVWTLFHSYAFDFSVWELWGALVYGGTLVIVPPETAVDPDVFTQLLCEEQVTVLNQTPSAFAALTPSLLIKKPNLRYVILAGEAINTRGLKNWLASNPQSRLFNGYGITETTVFVSFQHITKANVESGSYSPIGLPMDDLKLLILDEHQYPLPQGFPGELVITGPGVSQGYLANPLLSAQRFIKLAQLNSLAYRSGDLVRQLPDGSLEYLGRIDKQVKIRGYRIELGEIETALLNLDQVQEVVVLSNSHSLSAYLVPAPNTQLSEQVLRYELSKHLPQYMVPSHYYFLETLPLTINGKVNHARLHSLQKALPSPQDQEQLPNAMETLLLGVMEQLLNKKIALEDNFFEVGAHSLLLVQAHQRLKEQLQRDLPITLFFEYPNIKKLAQFLQGTSTQATVISTLKTTRSNSVAVIGMACRLPDANTPQQFWDNLSQGKENIRDIPDPECPENTYKSDAPYIARTAWIEDIDKFDAQFFNISAKEAQLIDPQQRILLELAYHALEDAGYSAITQRQNTGIFVSTSLNRYLLFHLLNNTTLQANTHPMLFLLGNDKDFSASRIAYKLNLQGPALNVQTACSSSLVAVHQAIQSIRSQECTMAIAGGISINPKLEGYFYEEGGIGSKDGHCKPFDHKASGTVAGNGGALVVLKNLEAAIADNDRIYAVIKGSAINNDGAEKVGFVAPGISGQTQVIQLALQDAGLDKDSISYVETHGTATQLGDAIELAALHTAYGNEHHPKFLGALKANLGHLDAAAGVCGLVKVIMTLQHKMLPPLIHFERFPDQCSYQAAFTVPQQLTPWIATKRTAAVSSFGIGGTNAHMIVQEYSSDPKPTLTQAKTYHLLLSAKTEQALKDNATRLAAFMQNNIIDLVAVEYTLALTRAHWEHRLLVQGATKEELILQLQSTATQPLEHYEQLQAQIITQGKKTGLKIISLPNYSFARTSFWHPASAHQPKKQAQLYAPAWQQVTREFSSMAHEIDVIFMPPNSDHLFNQALSPRTITIYAGPKYNKLSPTHYVLNPAQNNDYETLWRDIKNHYGVIQRIVYAWSYSRNCEKNAAEWEYDCLLSPMSLLQTLIHHYTNPIILLVCRSYSAKVVPTDSIKADAGLLEGIILTVPQEIPSISIQALDLPANMTLMDKQLLVDWLQGKVYFNTATQKLALRFGCFWLYTWQAYNPVSEKTGIAPQSTVVISGGSGGIAQALATHIVTNYQCKVVCLSRTKKLPQQSTIQMMHCDVTDLEQVQQTFACIAGPIEAIIHLAGQAAEKLFIRKDHHLVKKALTPKTQGTRHLAAMSQHYNIPKLILFSSASSLLGGIGELEYCAANHYMDCFALENNTASQQVLSINWGAWAKLGMRQNLLTNHPQEELTICEALNLFDQAVKSTLPQLAAIPYPLTELKIRYQNHLQQALTVKKAPPSPAFQTPRPILSSSYRPPKQDLEKQLSLIWQRHLGIEQIGLDDNFFELGGDSLTALEMKSETEKILGIELTLDVFMRSQTIDALLKNSQTAPESKDNILVPLTNSSHTQNLFCVHAVMGTVFSFIELAKKVEKHLNFYALQSPQLSNALDYHETIPAIASRYIQSLYRQQPQGPYFIAGWSFGGLIAYEMARQIIANQKTVAHLFIIDMAIPSPTNPQFKLSEEETKARFLMDLEQVVQRPVNEQDPEFESLLAIFTNHVHTTKRYFTTLSDHTALNCPTTLFSASEGIIKSCANSDLGWESYLNDYQRIDLEGDHYSILKNPIVDQLSKLLINKIKGFS